MLNADKTPKNSDKSWLSEHWKDLCISLFVILFVTAIWWGVAHWIDLNIKSIDLSKETESQAKGLFGDKFGAVNALFSAFAFAGIIYTILLQRKDLNQTRSAFEDQIKSIDQQRFDTTFFSLLELHNDITSKLSEIEQSGRKAFNALHERLKYADKDFHLYIALSKLDRDKIRAIRDDAKNVENHLLSLACLDESDKSNIIKSLESGTSGIDNHLDQDLSLQERKLRDAYTSIAEKYIDGFSHYFRNLYHILRFIDESTLISDKEKTRYARIVRSQLTEIELISLFYNSAIKIELPGREYLELGYPKMGKLLIKHQILNNMSPRSLFHPDHQKIFNKSYGINQ